MNVVMVCGLCITACVLCKIVEKNTKEISLLISVLVVAMIMIVVIDKISEINVLINELFDKVGISEQYNEILFKSLGICYITQIGSDVCKDCNEASIATAVETFGRISILFFSIPIIKALVVLIEGLLL